MQKIFLLLLFLTGCLHAQQTTEAASVVTVNNGLSQGMVFDILQSRDGFIWIATKDGLNRYDGYHCKIFWPDPFDRFSISASDIRKIYEDSRGRLWVCTPLGLDIYIPESGRFFHVSNDQLSGFTTQSDIEGFADFAEMPDGSIWVLTSGLIFKIGEPSAILDAAGKAGNAYPTLQITSISPPVSNKSPDGVHFISIFHSTKHALLVGTSGGLYAADPLTGRLTEKALSGTPVRITGEDKTGQIWLQVPGKPVLLWEPAWRYFVYENWPWQSCIWDGKAVSPLRFETERGDIFRFDREGYLWLLHKNRLRKWHPGNLPAGGNPELDCFFSEPSVNMDDFHPPSMTIDRSGIVWVGTNGYGLLKVTLEKPKFTSYLPQVSQRYLDEDPEGNIHTATEPDVLYTSMYFKGHIPNPWFPVRIYREQIYRLVFDAAGNCWKNGEADQLYRMDAQSKSVRSFPWKGRGLIYSKRGKLYGASEEGLMQFDPVTEQSTLIRFDRLQKLPSTYAFIHCLFEDAAGDIWIFVYEGLIRAHPEREGFRFEYFKNNPADPTSLFNNFILSVADDPLEPARYLWVGTKVGLDRLDKQAGTFRHFGTGQGLPDNVIYGILSDNSGHIWLSTNKGLCRFHVREETVKNFTLADGLQSNEFNQGCYLKTRDGALLFGGVNGITSFYPDSLRFNQHIPQMQIVDVQVNNEAIRNDRLHNLSLTYRQNFLTLEFAALEFSNPSQNHYRYRLIRHSLFGWEEDEHDIDLREKNVVQLANLQPGRYTFKVLGSNNDDVWSTEPAVLEFVIAPPWWAAWWAYLLYASLAVTGVWLFYRYQLRRRMESQETLRLRELDDFKNRFFTNITHEFRTPLTVILGTTQQLSDQPFEPPVRNKLKLIRRNGENLLRLINQLLDLAKLESRSLKINYEQGDVLAYLRYITESLHSFADVQKVMMRVESSESSIVMDYDPERLLQIVYNLLSNAVKFTPSGGEVVLRAATVKPEGAASPFLQITVTDTGVGIPTEDLPYIFDRFYQANNLEKAKAGGTGIGLSLTRELVGMMQGSISVESTPGQGAAFTVLLPILNRSEMREVRSEMRDIRSEKREVRNEKREVRSEMREAESGEVPHVLIIEDNPDVVEYLAACLKQGDHEGRPYVVDFAYNGRVGIEKALENIPDLIISDVMMPEKDGFEVCDTLKNDERTSHIPLILLTARADVESRLAGLRRGADAYLSKPFHQEELLLTLHNLLELRRKMQIALRDRSIMPSNEPEQQVVHAPAPVPDPENAFLGKIISHIEQHLDEAEFGVPEMSRAMGLSQSQLYRKIKALTDLSTAGFIRNVRLKKGKHLLETTDLTVSEVAYEVGFTSPNYFSDAFLEMFGARPTEIRK